MFVRAWQSVAVPAWLVSVRSKTLLSCLVVVAALACVTKITSVATRGYEVHELENKLALVAEETQKLETEMAEYQSMASIQKRLEGMQLVSVTAINYVSAGHDVAVAKR